jgi:hypothetical protein
VGWRPAADGFCARAAPARPRPAHGRPAPAAADPGPGPPTPRPGPSAGQPTCRVHGAAVRNDLLPAMMAAGALLFWFAASLSTSAAFRISTGTSMFVATSLALLVVLMLR